MQLADRIAARPCRLLTAIAPRPCPPSIHQSRVTCLIPGCGSLSFGCFKLGCDTLEQGFLRLRQDHAPLRVARCQAPGKDVGRHDPRIAVTASVRLLATGSAPGKKSARCRATDRAW